MARTALLLSLSTALAGTAAVAQSADVIELGPRPLCLVDAKGLDRSRGAPCARIRARSGRALSAGPAPRRRAGAPRRDGRAEVAPAARRASLPAMLIVVVILVVFIVLALLNTGGTAGCRWREDRTVEVEGLSYWRCHVCGATEKTPPGRPPNVCRAPR